MKFFTVKTFFQYHMPVTLSLFMCVTVERTVTTDGGYTALYGLPFPYITGSYACSFCYDVFLPAMILNLLFFFVFTLTAFTLLQKAGWQLKTHRLFILIGIVVSLFWVTVFALQTHDAFFKFKNDVAYQIKAQRILIGVKP